MSRFGSALPVLPRSLEDLPPEMSRQQVLDRYHQHTQVRAGGELGRWHGGERGGGRGVGGLGRWGLVGWREGEGKASEGGGGQQVLGRYSQYTQVRVG